MHQSDIAWRNEFGNEYNRRNKPNIENNYQMFKKMGIKDISNSIELGCGYGYALLALKKLFPQLELNGVEINQDAITHAKESGINVLSRSIYDFVPTQQYDFVLAKGILIYVEEKNIENIYKLLYNLAKKYICICEYYNPETVIISHRGVPIYKRDYGKLGDLYPDLELINYGFVHKRDQYPQDDATWFLLEKKC